jgi:dienelactone hydrolase
MSTIGCLERPQAPVQPAPDPATGAANPYLTDWKVLGPFSWTSQERDAARLASGLDQPLAPFESQVISGRADLSPPASSTSFWQPKPARAENGEVRLHALLSSDGFQGAYAVTDVPSANETDAALLVEADDGVRVYLNGRLVHENTSSRRLQQFEDYVPVRLRKGTNQIALKLVTGDKRGGYWNSWSFAVGLRSLSAARQERAARNYLQELTTSVVTDGRLGLDLRLFERERMITVEIRDGASRLIRRVDLRSGDRRTVDVGDLPDGAYQVRLPESAAPEDFPFYKGNVATAQVALRKRGEELGLYNPRDPNLGALEQRLALLLTPDHRESQQHLWAAKVAMLLADWDTLIRTAGARRPLYRDSVGTHLRAVRSPVDGSDQHYLLHVPRSYRRERGPIPLVAIVPYQVETLRPFLESIPVAEFGVWGTITRIAEANGLAVLWLNNRGNTYGSDLGETDMLEAIAQVGRDYAIDDNRLYLFGSCTGGREALTLAAKYPDRFAAVGAMSPSARFRPYPPTSVTDHFGPVPNRQKSPLARLQNLTSIPLYTLHGDQNTHSPLAESLVLQKAAERSGGVLHLDVVPGATHLRFPVEPRATVFRWLAGHKRGSAPRHLVFTTAQMRFNRTHWLEIDQITAPNSEARIEAWQEGEGGTQIRVESRNVSAYRIHIDRLPQAPSRMVVRTNGGLSFDGPVPDRRELAVSLFPARDGDNATVKSRSVGGPVWDFFTAPFLVVAGTGGGASSSIEAERLALEFAEAWRKRYHGEVAIKSDQNVTESDVHDRNLLLIGDPGPTGILAQLSPRLPFHRRGRTLMGPGGARFKGEVVAQYVIPNPLNPARYLLVAASPARRLASMDPIQLPLKGWYDYAIWGFEGSRPPMLADVGRFDASWNRLVSMLRTEPGGPLAVAHRVVRKPPP